MEHVDLSLGWSAILRRDEEGRATELILADSRSSARITLGQQETRALIAMIQKGEADAAQSAYQSA